jgi:hypothetical protein
MRALQLGILAVVVAGMATLIGCESFRPNGPSLVGQHFGESFQKDVARQTANPNASHEVNESTPIDPDTAAIVMDRYFEKQSQPSSPQQLPSIIQIDAN